MTYSTANRTSNHKFVISTFNGMELKFLIHFFLSRFWALASIWVIFLTSQGISLMEVAYITTAYMLSMAIFEIPTGYIADRFGRKISIILAYFTQFTGIMIFAFAPSTLFFLIGFSIWGIGMTMNSGAEQAWLFDEINESNQYPDTSKRYQEVYGVMTTVAFLASTFAYFAGGFLAEFDLRYPIILTAFVFLFSGIWITTFKETTKPVNEKGATKRRTIDTLSVIKQPKVLMLTVISMFIGGMITAMIYWIQPYFDGSISLTYIGLIGALGVWAASIGSSLSKKLSDKMGKYMILGLVIAMSIGFLTMAIAPVIMVIVIFLLMRAFRGAFNPLMSTMLNKEFTSDIRATALSVVASITAFTIMLTEIASAFLIEKYSFEVFYFVAAIFLAFVTIPASLYYAKISE